MARTVRYERMSGQTGTPGLAIPMIAVMADAAATRASAISMLRTRARLYTACASARPAPVLLAPTLAIDH